jgi:branched-chain amino acid transport system permease protein
MQVVANAIVTAAGYLLVGIGFSLVYSTGRFFHIAHGVVLTMGAYATLVLSVNAQLPLAVAIFGGILVSTLLGLAIEAAVYRPLRGREATPTTLLIASLGVYVGLQAFIAMLFGFGTRTFGTGNPTEGINLFGARVTPVQIATVATAAGLVIGTHVVLGHSRIGKAIRAIGSDPELANAYGIHSNRVMLCVIGIASALVGVAAAFLAADSDMYPAMGFRVLLMAMIAAIVGGARNLYGIALGAITMALLQHFTAWWFSSRWQDAIAYATLLVFLLIRPQGFIGRPLRRAAI